MDIVKIVLEENVSQWVIRAEEACGWAREITDRKERSVAEEVAREWAQKHGFRSYTVSLFPMRNIPDWEVPL